MCRRLQPRAFTLIELLVVISIIAVLIAMLLPGSPRGGAADPVHEQPQADGPRPAQLREQRERLPDGVRAQVNYSLFWDIQTTVAETAINGFLCPSETHTDPYPTGLIPHRPTSSGAVGGTWLMWDPNVNKVGDGMFLVNKCVRAAEIIDGLGNTVAMSEVKTQSPVLRDGGNPNTADVPPPISATARSLPMAATSTRRSASHSGSTASTSTPGSAPCSPPTLSSVIRPAAGPTTWASPPAVWASPPTAAPTSNSPPAVTTPGASTPCSWTARCGLSKARSTGSSGAPWGRGREEK